MSSVDPFDDLRVATCSNGAPSARNLLVTVFGDTLLPLGADTAVSVQTLAALLASFGVSERLVRTSLTRLVNDDVLAVETTGRRSSYRVAPGALGLFRQADERIYRSSAPDWDGSWTMVVIDGSEATPARRARLRQELSWSGLGVVAPNVMASPLVDPEEAASVVAHVGDFENVLVSRARVIERDGTIGADELARRCAPLDEIGDRYLAFTERFHALERPGSTVLTTEEAFKLRILVVATFRRIVLADPLLPAELLPATWVGHRARATAGRIYRDVAARSDRFVAEVTDLDLRHTAADRFGSRSGSGIEIDVDRGGDRA